MLSLPALMMKGFNLGNSHNSGFWWQKLLWWNRALSLAVLLFLAQSTNGCLAPILPQEISRLHPSLTHKHSQSQHHYSRCRQQQTSNNNHLTFISELARSPTFAKILKLLDGSAATVRYFGYVNVSYNENNSHPNSSPPLTAKLKAPYASIGKCFQFYRWFAKVIGALLVSTATCIFLGQRPSALGQLNFVTLLFACYLKERAPIDSWIRKGYKIPLFQYKGPIAFWLVEEKTRVRGI